MTKNVVRKPMENGDYRGAHGQAYKDKSKPTDIRSSNINAAKGESDRSFFRRVEKILPYIAMCHNTSSRIDIVYHKLSLLMNI